MRGGSIYIQVVPDPHRPFERETFTAGAPCFIEDAIPDGYKDESTRTVYINGVKARGDELLTSGDSVMIVGQVASTIVVLQIVIALASALVARSLMAVPEPVTQGEDSYGFTGFKNTYLEGSAVPLVYGKVRVAPPIIAQSIDSAWSAYVLGRQERMRLLLAISDGPIYGLGDVVGEVTSDLDLAGLPAVTDPLINFPLSTRAGLKINGQDAANFDDVLINWRTGALNQDPPHGWADTSTDVTIDQELPEVTGIDEVSKPPGVYTSGNEITAATGDFAGYTMADIADRAELVFDLVRGLYKQDSSGAVVNSTASFRVQTWPVDSGGTRTGDTVIHPELHFTDSSQGEETVTVPIDLFDPANYTPPIAQGYISCTSSVYAKVAAPVDPVGLPALYASPVGLRFTASAWVRTGSLESSTVNAVFNSSKGTAKSVTTSFPYTVKGSTSSTSNSGVEFAVVSNIPVTLQETVHLAVYGWSGDGYFAAYSPSIGSPHDYDGKWIHVGVEWVGATATAQFHLNGVPLAPATVVQVGGALPAFHVENEMQFGRHVVAHTSANDLADVQILSGLHGDAIQKHFAATDKFGHQLTDISSDSPDTRTACHFAAEIAAGQIENLAFPASTAAGQVIDLVGAPLNATPAIDPAVYSAEIGFTTEGRYRFEVFRSNPVLDEPGVEVNAGAWKLLKLIEDEDFERPGLATATVEVLADDQISNSRPSVTVVATGRLVSVWDGLSTAFPTFSKAWTRNPAWICLDMLTDEESGMGAIYNKYKNIDLAAWKVWADYCDEGVEDAQGSPAFFGASASAATTAHPNGTVTIKIGILDSSGTPTGESVPNSWSTDASIRIKTASDAGYVTTSSDSIRLGIYDLHYESDDLAPEGYQHWAVVSVEWTADLTLPTASSVTGVAVGFEARHEFDLAFDSKTALGWDQIQVPMKASRAFPVRFGNTLSVFVDRARSPVAMLTMANIIEGSFELGWTGIDDRPNAVEIEYQDRAHDFDSEMLSIAHPSVAASDDLTAERRERMKLRGVTRRTEVIRHGYYRLNQHNLLRRVATFHVGLDAVALTPGSRFRLAHDVTFYGESGRIYSTSTSATEVALDRDVTLAAGKTYEVEVRSSTALGALNEEVRETVAIDASEIPGSGSVTVAAGTPITLSGAGFASLTPTRADVYSFGETGATAEDFAVVSITLDPDTMQRKIEAVEYNASVYDDNTWGLLPSDPEEGLDPPQPQGGPPTIKPPGDDFGQIGSAAETSIRGASGKPFAVIDVTIPPIGNESQTGGVNIWIADLSNGTVPVPLMVKSLPPGRKTARIDTVTLLAGNSYRVFIQRRGLDGSARPPQSSPSYDVTISGNVPIPTAPTITTPANRGTNAIYGIAFPQGQRPEGVEVRVGGWILGQKVAADLRDGELVSPSWVYGPTNAAGDGALDHYVRSLLPNGQVSDFVTFANLDSLPPGGTEVSAIAHEDAWGSGTLLNLVANADGDLEFTGSGLIGKFTAPTVDTGVAKRYYVEVAAKAWQDDGSTWASDTGLWGDRASLSGTWEGEVGGPDALLSALEIRWAPSETGTPASTFSTFKPGEAYFRSAQFQVVITRPDTSFDCILERFGVRVIEVPDYEPGNTDGGIL